MKGKYYPSGESLVTLVSNQLVTSNIVSLHSFFFACLFAFLIWLISVRVCVCVCVYTYIYIYLHSPFFYLVFFSLKTCSRHFWPHLATAWPHKACENQGLNRSPWAVKEWNPHHYTAREFPLGTFSCLHYIQLFYVQKFLLCICFQVFAMILLGFLK